jgi:hypothetical protein
MPAGEKRDSPVPDSAHFKNHHSGHSSFGILKRAISQNATNRRRGPVFRSLKASNFRRHTATVPKTIGAVHTRKKFASLRQLDKQRNLD